MAARNRKQRCAHAVERRGGHKRDCRGQCLRLSADLELLLFFWHEFDGRSTLQRDRGCGMRSQVNAISAKLTGGTVRYMKNVTNVTNGDSSGEPRESGVKKPYKAPSFRFEPVFEVAALACGKVFATQGGCRFSRKAS